MPSGARLLLLCSLCFAAGCGYVGDPLPPLANIPARIDDVASVQRGARLIVHLTSPRSTTEGAPLKAAPRVDLRIGVAEQPFNPDTWAAAARPIAPGVIQNGLAEYDLPAGEWTGKEVTIGARAVGPNGKAGAWSNFVNLTVVAPPPTPSDLNAAAVPEGVRLTWRGGPGDYRVFRRAEGETQFSLLGTAKSPEWLDRQVEFGKPYTYLAQRVVEAGAHVAESELSEAVSITPRDTFPPAAPGGLRGVAAPQSIELTWDSGPEPDLAGYRVYRAVADGEFERVGEVNVPAYSDRKVEAGKVYRYQVSAFDRAGNESGRSAAVTLGL